MADDATAEALYREARTRCQQGDIAAGIDLVQRAIALTRVPMVSWAWRSAVPAVTRRL